MKGKGKKFILILVVSPILHRGVILRLNVNGLTITTSLRTVRTTGKNEEETFIQIASRNT